MVGVGAFRKRAVYDTDLSCVILKNERRTIQFTLPSDPRIFIYFYIVTALTGLWVLAGCLRRKKYAKYKRKYKNKKTLVFAH